jgi:hypothetical protein
MGVSNNGGNRATEKNANLAVRPGSAQLGSARLSSVKLSEVKLSEVKLAEYEALSFGPRMARETRCTGVVNCVGLSALTGHRVSLVPTPRQVSVLRANEKRLQRFHSNRITKTEAL